MAAEDRLTVWASGIALAGCVLGLLVVSYVVS